MNNGITYMGDYIPVNVMRNNIKLVGWTNSEKTGTAVAWDRTYNDFVGGTVSGAAQQTQSVWGTNLVTNGDFSNGTTGWVGLNATITSESNVLTITAGGINYYPDGDQRLTIVTGHKYYVRCMAKVRNTGCALISILLDMGTPSATVNTPTPNTWYALSASGIATTDTKIRLRHAYADAATASGKVMDAKYVTCLDLTAIFGSGHEPTAAQVDAMLAAYPNSWFDGKARLTTDVTTYTANSPSSAYQSPISTAGNCNLTSSDGAGASSSIVLPRMPAVGAVKDTMVFQGGDVWRDTQNVGVKVFDGTEGGWAYTFGSGFGRMYINVTDSSATDSPVLCTHFIFQTAETYAANGVFWGGAYPESNKNLQFITAYTDVAAWKSWLAAEYAAGHPVTVYYQLATPIITDLHLGQLKSYPKHTAVTQDGSVLAGLDLTVKVADNAA